MRFFILFFIGFFLVSCQKSELATVTAEQPSGVIGGKEVQPADELASLVVGLWDEEGQFMCTGTLISESVVLTAAHCITAKPQALKVIFGLDVYKIVDSRDETVQRASVRQVISYKIHENYKDKESEAQPAIADLNDIALVKFQGGLPHGFKPAQFLENSKELTKGAHSVVAGFGVAHVEVSPIDIRKYSAKKLREGLEYGTIECDKSRKNCVEIEMSGDGNLRVAQAPIKLISDSEVRLDESKGQGTCSGDSGGPAFLQKEGEYFLWGVTSRGSMLCDYEGVYTNAISHRIWIQNNLKSF